MNTPNWQHNSQKKKKPRSTSKGKIKARKQVLKCLKAKFM